MTADFEHSGRGGGTMYEAVRHWAERTPEAPALLLGDGRAALSYSDLLRSIDAIGAQLRLQVEALQDQPATASNTKEN